jgi:hypothetical protein
LGIWHTWQPPDKWRSIRRQGLENQAAGQPQQWGISYLYSPCFDVTGLATPTSVSALPWTLKTVALPYAMLPGWSIQQTEPPGKSLVRPAPAQTGTTKPSPRNNWSIQNYTYWHVATQALPTGIPRLRLRFVLAADGGVAREGFAIDDVHLYDNTAGIYDGPTLPAPLTGVVSGNSWTHFTEGGKLVASIQAQGQHWVIQPFRHLSARALPGSAINSIYHNRNLTINRQLPQQTRCLCGFTLPTGKQIPW